MNFIATTNLPFHSADANFTPSWGSLSRTDNERKWIFSTTSYVIYGINCADTSHSQSQHVFALNGETQCSLFETLWRELRLFVSVSPALQGTSCDAQITSAIKLNRTPVFVYRMSPWVVSSSEIQLATVRYCFHRCLSVILFRMAPCDQYPWPLSPRPRFTDFTKHGTYPLPATDIRWSALETCSNLFTWWHTPFQPVLTSGGGRGNTYVWKAGGTYRSGMHSCLKCCQLGPRAVPFCQRP